MPKSFAEDFTQAVRAGATRARDFVQGNGRGLPPSVGVGVAASLAALIIGGALVLRGGGRAEQVAPVRASDLGPASVERKLARGPAQRSYAAARVEESKGSFRGAAEGYAEAARQGDARGLSKLVAMTHAKKCEARSEAADALGTLRDKRARAALKKLTRAHFKDEGRSPGIFSCSSRRAAQKALEHQRG